MALFKIFKGLESDLNFTTRPWTEGYCYYTTDNSKFLVDSYKKETSETRVADRTYYTYVNKAYIETTPTTTVGSTWATEERNIYYYRDRIPLNSEIADYAVRAYYDQYGNNLNNIMYAICNSAIDTTEKEAELDFEPDDDFEFSDGQLVIINFLYGSNEINNATLDFGPGSEYFITNNTQKIPAINPNTLVLFRYDTNQWVLVSGGASSGSSGSSSVQLVRWGEEDN